jgi:hypothetical protein
MLQFNSAQDLMEAFNGSFPSKLSTWAKWLETVVRESEATEEVIKQCQENLKGQYEFSEKKNWERIIFSPSMVKHIIGEKFENWADLAAFARARAMHAHNPQGVRVTHAASKEYAQIWSYTTGSEETLKTRTEW